MPKPKSDTISLKKMNDRCSYFETMIKSRDWFMMKFENGMERDSKEFQANLKRIADKHIRGV